MAIRYVRKVEPQTAPQPRNVNTGAGELARARKNLAAVGTNTANKILGTMMEFTKEKDKASAEEALVNFRSGMREFNVASINRTPSENVNARKDTQGALDKYRAEGSKNLSSYASGLYNKAVDKYSTGYLDSAASVEAKSIYEWKTQTANANIEGKKEDRAAVAKLGPGNGATDSYGVLQVGVDQGIDARGEWLNGLDASLQAIRNDIIANNPGQSPGFYASKISAAEDGMHLESLTAIWSNKNPDTASARAYIDRFSDTMSPELKLKLAPIMQDVEFKEEVKATAEFITNAAPRPVDQETPLAAIANLETQAAVRKTIKTGNANRRNASTLRVQDMIVNTGATDVEIQAAITEHVNLFPGDFNALSNFRKIQSGEKNQTTNMVTYHDLLKLGPVGLAELTEIEFIKKIGTLSDGDQKTFMRKRQEALTNPDKQLDSANAQIDALYITHGYEFDPTDEEEVLLNIRLRTRIEEDLNTVRSLTKKNPTREEITKVVDDAFSEAFVESTGVSKFFGSATDIVPAFQAPRNPNETWLRDTITGEAKLYIFDGVNWSEKGGSEE